MTQQEVIQILTDYADYRNGILPFQPAQHDVTQAIEKAVDLLKEIRPDRFKDE